MIEIAFATLASISLASSVVDIKRGLQKTDYISCSIVISVVGLIIYFPITLLFTDFNKLDYGSLMLFAIGGLLSPGLVRLFFFKSIEKVGALVTTSIMPSQPIITAILAVVLLSEQASIGLWVGIFTIVIGAIIIETSRSKGQNSKTFSLWILLPLLGVFSGSLSDPIRKVALNMSNLPILGTTIANLSSLLLYYLAYFTIGDRKEFNPLNIENFKLMWKGGILMGLGWLFSFYALSYGNVTRVTPIINAQPLFVYILARLYPKDIEAVSIKPLIGAIIIILGIVVFLST
ncbi:MAG: EamA family transporter [Nitrososphaeria archaeon]